MANLRTQRGSAGLIDEDQLGNARDRISEIVLPGSGKSNRPVEVDKRSFRLRKISSASSARQSARANPVPPSGNTGLGHLQLVGRVLKKYSNFIGPGFMVSVAYIDPGNYSTDVAAGASTRFKLLFIVLMSNIFAIVLQSLAVRLGTVTGLNLAEHCRAHLPRWLNFGLYILGEGAIIATDIAEVSRP